MDREIKNILSPLIGDLDDEIIQYMITIKQEDDLDEFLSNVTDSQNPEHSKAIKQLKKIMIGDKSSNHKVQERYLDNKLDDRLSDISNKNDKCTVSNLKTKYDNKEESIYQNRNTKPIQKSNNTFQKASNNTSMKSDFHDGKKINYINFDTFTNTPALKKGRHPCNCEARIHALVNNCLKCGRIVCEQEGSGPCFFCDNMVATKAEMEILSASTKESSKLYNKLMEQRKSKEWKKAIELRNRLVSNDQMGELKNKIYDDQADYFDTNFFSSSKSREHTLKSKTKMKIALDLATRVAISEDKNDDFNKNKEKLLKNVSKLLDTTEKRFPKNLFEGKYKEIYEEIAKEIEQHPVPTKASSTQNKNKLPDTRSFNRIANEEFLEHLDRGMCLSMHQPWASLLIAGIKEHEGRTWKTDHRGRLWIHAASKEPEDEEILACEEFYRQYYNDPTLQFPKKYPTSCLLGCVCIEDCLDQKEYRERYPNGESNSPYVLICSNPMILPIFLPMSGDHKIFRLNKEIHMKAKEALMASTWI